MYQCIRSTQPFLYLWFCTAQLSATGTPTVLQPTHHAKYQTILHFLYCCYTKIAFCQDKISTYSILAYINVSPPSLFMSPTSSPTDSDTADDFMMHFVQKITECQTSFSLLADFSQLTSKNFPPTHLPDLISSTLLRPQSSHQMWQL